VAADLDTLLGNFEAQAEPTERSAGAGSELDALLAEFDPAGSEPAVPADEDAPDQFAPLVQPALRIGGSVGLDLAYNYARGEAGPGRADYRGLNKVRASGRLQLDWRASDRIDLRLSARAFRDYAYALKDRARFRRETLDAYQSEAEVQEAWLRLALPGSVQIKTGRQVLNVGFADDLRVLDVLNPVDNREPASVDLENLRLPVAMTRVDYSRGPWRLTGAAVHESRFDHNPALGAEFFPFDAALPGRSDPGNGGGDTEYLLRAERFFSVTAR